MRVCLCIVSSHAQGPSDENHKPVPITIQRIILAVNGKSTVPAEVCYPMEKLVTPALSFLVVTCISPFFLCQYVQSS